MKRMNMTGKFLAIVITLPFILPMHAMKEDEDSSEDALTQASQKAESSKRGPNLILEKQDVENKNNNNVENKKKRISRALTTEGENHQITFYTEEEDGEIVKQSSKSQKQESPEKLYQGSDISVIHLTTPEDRIEKFFEGEVELDLGVNNEKKSIRLAKIVEQYTAGQNGYYKYLAINKKTGRRIATAGSQFSQKDLPEWTILIIQTQAECPFEAEEMKDCLYEYEEKEISVEIKNEKTYKETFKIWFTSNFYLKNLIQQARQRLQECGYETNYKATVIYTDTKTRIKKGCFGVSEKSEIVEEVINDGDRLLTSKDAPHLRIRFEQK